MDEFSVWAPNASTVELCLPASGTRMPMTASAQGWWTVSMAGAGHGTDYAYCVDGSAPMPDPRGGWQPNGVHEPSRVFDPARHQWQDGGWAGRDVLGALFYELHLGTFTPQGTLDAAIAHLGHLAELGVDVVELMPVAAFEGLWGWGYDGVAPYAVHEPYGGPAALQRFVDACHGHGLAVCLDVVYNHLGPSGNYVNQFGPYFSDHHHTPWGQGVNLDDTHSAEVRRWICDNALRWFSDFHVDALRLDAVHALIDDSPVHVLAQLSQEVAELSTRLERPLGLVAETDLNDPFMIEPVAEGGRGMTAQWDDDVHHALHVLLTGEDQGYYVDFPGADVVARTLTSAFRHAGDFSTFRGKVWGRPVDPARHRGQRFLAYLQTHDQVGNRALGERIGQLCTPGRAAVGAALVMTSAFTPMIFMGEEWDASTPWLYMTDFQDPELAAAVREGRRSEFAGHGWRADDIPDPQDPATRERSVLQWSEVGVGRHGDMLRWYRALVALRRREPELREDNFAAVRVRTGEDWLVVHRGAWDVLANLGSQAQVLPAPADARVELAWGDVEERDGGLLVPPEAVAIVRH